MINGAFECQTESDGLELQDVCSLKCFHGFKKGLIMPDDGMFLCQNNVWSPSFNSTTFQRLACIGEHETQLHGR